MNSFQKLTTELESARFNGHTFHCLPIQGQHDVLRVEVERLSEVPIFITLTETQILCIAYLAQRTELKAERTDELNELLLELNVPMPLSSFALVEDYYVIFGALSLKSNTELIQTELVTLAENAEQALQALEEFVL